MNEIATGARKGCRRSALNCIFVTKTACPWSIAGMWRRRSGSGMTMWCEMLTRFPIPQIWGMAGSAPVRHWTPTAASNPGGRLLQI